MTHIHMTHIHMTRDTWYTYTYSHDTYANIHMHTHAYSNTHTDVYSLITNPATSDEIYIMMQEIWL